MLILKFGGTSVGSVERIQSLPNIILPFKGKKIVVLSAMSGMTNNLVMLSNYLYKSEFEQAKSLIENLQTEHETIINELFQDNNIKEQAIEFINKVFVFLGSYTEHTINIRQEKEILAQGEIISTNLFHLYLNEIGIKNTLIPALNFMRVDKDDEPDLYYVKENLNRELEKNSQCEFFITQGYICKNVFGETDNLKRGGSDYTASIIGSALKAEEVQIWTDISGVHNNDPRYVDNTYPIPELSFEEAAELAYFGAKIIHPTSLQPAMAQNIPVRLKNTFKPDEAGTLITSKQTTKGFKSVAAKDGITVIKIRSARMLLAYGFLRKVFEVFENFKTPVDVITTSEVAVSLTIDDESHLEGIVSELNKFGSVEVEKNKSIVCIVGNIIGRDAGYANAVFNALKDIPIRMISYGGSNYNITVVVNQSDKVETLKALNNHLDFFKPQ